MVKKNAQMTDIKVKTKGAREYYLNEAVEQNCSVRALERQIHTLYYERILTFYKRVTILLGKLSNKLLDEYAIACCGSWILIHQTVCGELVNSLLTKLN